MIIGSNLIHFDNLPSTNEYAAELVKNSDPREGTIIYTDYQSAGKGHMGNKWESGRRMNLLISAILFPSFVRPDDQFLISMAVSLTICDFLRRYTQICSIKWPNDIYVSNDKIAGILIENIIMQERIKNTIAGIGLNINQIRFVSNAPNPVSLSLITGESYDLTVCLRQLSENLDKRYKQLIAGEFNSIREEYVSNLYRLNEWHIFRDSSGLFNGRIKGVNFRGIIQIETADERLKEYSFKEVDFVLQDPSTR
jgi:BirA family biotin operon repressor/biotin-[acetyl-CoA-carboxylase] ligase